MTELEYPVADVISRRRSRRAYTDQPVEEEKIRSLFEAARWAPSSMNEQPWKYIYATKEQMSLWEKIFESLNASNQLWVRHAPLLVASITRKNFTRNDQPNHTAKYDLGAANALLSIQATELGLNVHQMGGYNQSTLRKNLNIPEEYELGVVMAIGYPGDPEILPDALRQRELAPRQRLSQSNFVLNSAFPV